MNVIGGGFQKLAEATSILMIPIMGALSLYFLIGNCEGKSPDDCIKEEPYFYFTYSF